MEFLLAAQNAPFAVAIGLMLLFAVVEGVGSLLGLGVSHVLEGMLPDIDLDLDIDADLDADLNADPGIAHTSGLTAVLGWLHIGRVPMMILFSVFLLTFGLSGYVIQSLYHSLTTSLLSGWYAAPIAYFVSLPIVHLVGNVLEKIIPKDETSAVSEQSFIGHHAQITIGTASAGKPAEAKLRDEHGKTHYIMVEPDDSERSYEQGQSVIVLEKKGSGFTVTSNETEQESTT